MGLYLHQEGEKGAHTRTLLHDPRETAVILNRDENVPVTWQYHLSPPPHAFSSPDNLLAH